MERCPHLDRVQDHLDGVLAPDAQAAFEAHLVACPACTAELAAYAPVFAHLADPPSWEPGPDFTARVVAAAMPAPVPLAFVLAWAGGAFAASAAIVACAVLPAPRAALVALLAGAVHAFARASTVLFKSLVLVLGGVDGLLHMGFGVLRGMLPLVRILATPLASPIVVLVLLAALLSGACLLWWMRPLATRAGEGGQDARLLIV